MQLDALPFDPNIYFGHVADNLLNKFGGKALDYADEALRKMRAIGDDEGFNMWLGVQKHLNLKAEFDILENQVTLH